MKAAAKTPGDRVLEALRIVNRLRRVTRGRDPSLYQELQKVRNQLVEARRDLRTEENPEIANVCKDMKPADQMTDKEIKDVLFRHYQWPPSCLPKDGDKLRQLLLDCRKRHPQIRQ